MNRQRSAFCSNSGQYVDFVRYTSTSAIMMASSSAVPGSHGWPLPVETVETPEPADARQPRDDASCPELVTA
jgi:hypothetical protein